MRIHTLGLCDTPAAFRAPLYVWLQTAVGLFRPAFILGSFVTLVDICVAQSTGFTYQGLLQDWGGPAQGTYDLRIALFDTRTNGIQLCEALTNSDMAFSNGVFTVTLDFGTNLIAAGERWLELAVRTNGATFVSLSPRQPLTGTPFALSARQVTGSVAASQISGPIATGQLPPGLLTNGSAGVALSGTFSGDGSGITNLTLQGFAGEPVTNHQTGVTLTGTFYGDGSALTNLPGADWRNVLTNGSQSVNFGRSVTISTAIDGTSILYFGQYLSGCQMNYDGYGLNWYVGRGNMYFDGDAFSSTVPIIAPSFRGEFVGDGSQLTGILDTNFPPNILGGNQQLYTWGDSMTAGNWTAPYYPYTLGLTNRLPFLTPQIRGYPGRNADYIASNFWFQVEHNADITNAHHIFWLGNVGGVLDATSVLTNTIAMANVVGERYLVLSLVGSSMFTPQEWVGLLTVNNLLAKQFGEHYYDLNKSMLAASTNNSEEVAQARDGLIASNRLRYDYIHWTELGYRLAGTNIGNYVGPIWYPPQFLSRSMAGTTWQPIGLSNGQGGVRLSGAFAGDGSGLTNLNIQEFPVPPLTNRQAGVTLMGVFSGDGGALTNLSFASNFLTGGQVDAALAGSLTITSGEDSNATLWLGNSNAGPKLEWDGGGISLTSGTNGIYITDNPLFVSSGIAGILGTGPFVGSFVGDGSRLSGISLALARERSFILSATVTLDPGVIAIAAFGNGWAEGAGGPCGKVMPPYSTVRRWYPQFTEFHNYAISGSSWQTMETNFLAHAYESTNLVILFCGGNVNGPDYASLTNILSHSHNINNVFVVGSLVSSCDSNGSYWAGLRTNWNSLMTSTLGTHFIDVNPYIWARTNGSEADAQAVARGVFPLRLYCTNDFNPCAAHLTEEGYAYVGDALAIGISNAAFRSFRGYYEGDASGVTNVSTAALVAPMGGVTTNLSLSGCTLHITNGVIVQVTCP